MNMEPFQHWVHAFHSSRTGPYRARISIASGRPVFSKPANSRPYVQSGRRDLKSGPLVPQTSPAVRRLVSRNGAKWPTCRDFVVSPTPKPGCLHEPNLRRLGAYWARSP